MIGLLMARRIGGHIAHNNVRLAFQQSFKFVCRIRFGKILANDCRSGNRLGFQYVNADNLSGSFVALNRHLRPSAGSTTQIHNRFAFA